MIVKHSNSISCEIIYTGIISFEKHRHIQRCFFDKFTFALKQKRQLMLSYIVWSWMQISLESDYFDYYVALGKKNKRRLQFGMVTILSG